jgi:tetratricopeptide (TPR) repeat protein
MKNVLSKGVPQAIEPFLNANKKSTIKENEMNGIGYQLLGMGKVQEAKEVFRLNMGAYPQSADVYDSYAEACLANGEYKLATQYYQKSLELNPQNKSAQHLVNQLKTSSSKKYNTTIKLKGFPDAKLITLVGTFNGWNHLHTILFKKGDEWIAKLNLAPGKYSTNL